MRRRGLFRNSASALWTLPTQTWYFCGIPRPRFYSVYFAISFTPIVSTLTLLRIVASCHPIHRTDAQFRPRLLILTLVWPLGTRYPGHRYGLWISKSVCYVLSLSCTTTLRYFISLALQVASSANYVIIFRAPTTLGHAASSSHRPPWPSQAHYGPVSPFFTFGVLTCS